MILACAASTMIDMDPAAYGRGLLDGDAGKPADLGERDRGYLSGYIEGQAHRGGFECRLRDHETIMRARELAATKKARRVA